MLIPWLLLWTPMLLGSCGERVRSQLQSKHDPATAASKALEAHDRNGDSKLSAEELKATPALAQSATRIDTNRDGFVTDEEIRVRFAALDEQSDLVALELQVTLQGKPLRGASVTVTPELFMGEGLQSYEGTTNEGGFCSLVGSHVDLPGLPHGFYQVKIVQLEQGIDVVRGCEIADDVTGNRLRFEL